MNKDSGNFGHIVGGLFAMAAVILIFSGGEFSGKKTFEGARDLPPIATPDPNQPGPGGAVTTMAAA